MYEVFNCSSNGIAKCAYIIKSGGVIVFPTDTIYGIGCDPYNDSAVKRIYKIKGRDENKPLPVLTCSTEDAEKIVLLGRTGKLLASKYWPGALTIVAPLTDRRISARVTAKGKNLAVRVPDNKCVLSLLWQCKYLVGTSANLSGEKPFQSAHQVLESSLEGFDALLDGGIAEKGMGSTVIDITGAKTRILREGAIKVGEVQELLGEV